MNKTTLTSDEANIINILTIINSFMFNNIPLSINGETIKNIKDYIEELKIALDDKTIELLNKLVDNITKLRSNDSFTLVSVIKK